VPGQQRYATQMRCPIARAMAVVDDRWTVLVLRDLAWGPQRFSRLQRSLGGISANILSERLQRLERHGMVERVFYSDHPPRAEYRLTPKGRAFIPVLRALRDFGEQWVPLEPSTGSERLGGHTASEAAGTGAAE
jgi:DNA-binding HxlR family transcriptional regulator